MARSRSRSRRGSRSGSKSGSRSGSKAATGGRSKKGQENVDETFEEAELEVVEESKSFGIDDGMVIVTTLLLIAAFCLTDYLLGADYAKGLFWAGSFGG